MKLPIYKVICTRVPIHMDFQQDGKEKLLATIQPPPNQLANIDFDVIGTSDY